LKTLGRDKGDIMKVKYARDEWYPVYILDDHCPDGEIEISQELYDRYKKVDAEWHEVQHLIAEIEEGKNECNVT
jgi:hypothetical protein